MRDDGDINRRSVLKSVGASATAAGVLSTLSINVAAAQAADEERDPVEILDGEAKLSLASELADTPEFEAVLETARAEGYSLEWEAEEIYAGRTEAGSFRREVTSYNLRGAAEDEHAAIHVGRDMTDGSIIFAQFDVEHHTERGIAQKTVRREVAAPGSSDDIAALDVETRVIQSDPRTQEEFVAALDRSDPSADIDIPDDFPVELDISTCTGCYYASTLVCRNLCGAGGGFLCGLLGITLIGGLSCVTFVGAVCWVLGKAPQCADPVAATICKGTGLGICGPNEKPGSPLDVDIPQL